MKKRTFRDFTPLRESGSPKSESTRGGQIYKNVAIIKAGLGNRRDKNFYPRETLKEAAKAKQFEGLRAFADHPDALSEETRPERSIRDIVGVYTNTRFKEAGGGQIVGDLRVLKSASWLSDMIDELVDMGQADKVGISINGRGHTEPMRVKLEESGEEVDANVLRKFLELRSADVVTEAGAGGGFQQLLESARTQENGTMTTKELGTLREAALKGDKDAIKKLAKAAAASTEDDATPGKPAKEAVPPQFLAKKKKGKKAAAAAVEAESDETEETDPDQELDDAADELVAEADEGTDDDADVEEADESDGDEADESESDEDDEDDEDGDVEEADTDGDEEPAAKRAAKSNGKKAKAPTREAIGAALGKLKSTKGLTGKPKQVSASGAKNVKGVATSGAGSAVASRAKSGKTYTGQRFGSAREAALDAELKKTKIRNERLAEALRVRQGTDRAKKLLRESGIPSEMCPELLRRMVGRSDREMQDEIRFTQKLLETAWKQPQGNDFDEIEGAGSSLRESFSRGGNDTEIDALIEGLPLKEADADDDE